jgi:hypothetical protein
VTIDVDHGSVVLAQRSARGSFFNLGDVPDQEFSWLNRDVTYLLR